jgi:hypothetical protein
MRPLIRAGFIAAAGLSTVSLCRLQAFAQPQDYNAGMEAYGRRDFAAARQYFARMVKDAPEDPLGHYYLANTLVFMKDMAGATKEYQTAIESADSDDVKSGCETALQAMKKSGVKGAAAALEKTASLSALPAGPALIPQPAGTQLPGIGSTGKGDAKGAGGTGAGATPGTANIGSATPPGADASKPAAVSPENMSLLQKQVEDRKKQVQQENEKQQKATLDLAKMQADRIKAEHNYDAPYGRRARYYAEQYKREGAQQANDVLQRANQQAAAYKKYINEKQAVLDDVANSLDSQMNQTGGSSKIHLKREGTNLNVRNYEFNH